MEPQENLGFDTKSSLFVLSSSMNDGLTHQNSAGTQGDLKIISGGNNPMPTTNMNSSQVNAMIPQGLV
jgi:hypothetical protein